jgi:hypothetical protein
MRKIQLTKGFVALVDDEDFEYLNQWKWNAQIGTHTWYAVRNYGKRPNRKKLWMHKVIMNTPNKIETDHINNNGLDNRKENLRKCKKEENQWNIPKRKNNTSGFIGVYPNMTKKKFISKIQFGKIRIHLGSYNTIEEAAYAYDKAAIKYHGNFAKLNGVNNVEKI